MVFMTMILAWNMLSLKGMVREDRLGRTPVVFLLILAAAF